MFSIRNLLISIILTISTALCLFVGISAYSSFKSYRDYSEAARLASVNKSVFNALSVYRDERGVAASSLQSEPATLATSLERIKSERVTVDTELAEVSGLKDSLASQDVRNALSKMFDVYNKVVAMRPLIDTALTKDVASRDPKLRQDVLSVGDVLLGAMEAASTAVEADLRTVDPSMVSLAQIRSLAWSVRASTGGANLIFTSQLSSRKPMTPEDFRKIQASDATSKALWQAVTGLVQHPATPDTIKNAFEKATASYYDPKLMGDRDAALAKFQAGEVPALTVDEWRPRVSKGLNDIAAVASEAAERLASKTESRRQSALTELVLYILGFVVFMLVSVVGIGIIVLRVIRPIGALTRCMDALAQGDRTVQVPGESRTDEIGGMARSVEVFRQAAIRNAQLETEAEENRKRNENERVELQRRAEAEAEERLTKATGSLASGLKRLADGDMLCEIHEEFAPQFEALRHDFNRSVEQLRTALLDVGNAAHAVRNGSGEISQASDNLAKRTEQQAASLEETAAALEEITANVKATSQRTGDARDLVRNTRSKAEHSGSVVSNAVTAMGRIEEASSKITQIISVIDEIAFQTNLLALNAGVEAARAGEAGKGFAVVAQEVRELAQRSANAAKEIKALIANSEVAVGDGVKLVNDTGKGLSEIAELVQAINAHMDAIATAAQEQSVGLGEVNTAVNHMDQATQQNAAMVEEMNAAGAGLNQEAVKLGDLLGRFRTGNAAAPQAYATNTRAQDSRVSARPAPTTSRPVMARGTSAAALKPQAWEDF